MFKYDSYTNGNILKYSVSIMISNIDIHNKLDQKEH